MYELQRSAWLLERNVWLLKDPVLNEAWQLRPYISTLCGNELAHTLCLEYAKFLLLRAAVPDPHGNFTAPPPKIEWVWTRHVMREPAKYSAFEAKLTFNNQALIVFREFADTVAQALQRYQITRTMYTIAYEQEPPLEIWPDASLLREQDFPELLRTASALNRFPKSMAERRTPYMSDMLDSVPPISKPNALRQQQKLQKQRSQPQMLSQMRLQPQPQPSPRTQSDVLSKLPVEPKHRAMEPLLLTISEGPASSAAQKLQRNTSSLCEPGLAVIGPLWRNAMPQRRVCTNEPCPVIDLEAQPVQPHEGRPLPSLSPPQMIRDSIKVRGPALKAAMPTKQFSMQKLDAASRAPTQKVELYRQKSERSLRNTAFSETCDPELAAMPRDASAKGQVKDMHQNGQTPLEDSQQPIYTPIEKDGLAQTQSEKNVPVANGLQQQKFAPQTTTSACKARGDSAALAEDAMMSSSYANSSRAASSHDARVVWKHRIAKKSVPGQCISPAQRPEETISQPQLHHQENLRAEVALLEGPKTAEKIEKDSGTKNSDARLSSSSRPHQEQAAEPDASQRKPSGPSLERHSAEKAIQTQLKTIASENPVSDPLPPATTAAAARPPPPTPSKYAEVAPRRSSATRNVQIPRSKPLAAVDTVRKTISGAANKLPPVSSGDFISLVNAFSVAQSKESGARDKKLDSFDIGWEADEVPSFEYSIRTRLASDNRAPDAIPLACETHPMPSANNSGSNSLLHDRLSHSPLESQAKLGSNEFSQYPERIEYCDAQECSLEKMKADTANMLSLDNPKPVARTKYLGEEGGIGKTPDVKDGRAPKFEKNSECGDRAGSAKHRACPQSLACLENTVSNAERNRTTKNAIQTNDQNDANLASTRSQRVRNHPATESSSEIQPSPAPVANSAPITHGFRPSNLYAAVTKSRTGTWLSETKKPPSDTSSSSSLEMSGFSGSLLFKERIEQNLKKMTKEAPSSKQSDPSDGPKGPFYAAKGKGKSIVVSHPPPASRKRPRSALQKALVVSNENVDLGYAPGHRDSDTTKPMVRASENIAGKPSIYGGEATDGGSPNLPVLISSARDSAHLGEDSGILTNLIALENGESSPCPPVKFQNIMNNQKTYGESPLGSRRNVPDNRSRSKLSGEESQAIKSPPMPRSGSKKIASTTRPSSSNRKSPKVSDYNIDAGDKLLVEKPLLVDNAISNGGRSPTSSLPSANVERNSKEPVQSNVRKCKKLAPGDSPLLASLGRTSVSESSAQNQSCAEAGSVLKQLNITGNASKSLSSRKRCNSVLLGGGRSGDGVVGGDGGGGSSSEKYSFQYSATDKCTRSEKAQSETTPTPSAGDSSSTQNINVSSAKVDLSHGRQPRRKKKPAKRTPIRKRRQEKGFEYKPVSLGPNIPHIIGGMNICFRRGNGQQSLPRNTRLWLSNIKTNYTMSLVKKSLEGAVKESQLYKKYCEDNENMTFSLRFLGIDGKEHRIKEGQIKFRKILEKHGYMYVPNKKNTNEAKVTEPIPSLAVFVDMPALSAESETEELKESSLKNDAAEPDATEMCVAEVGTVETDTKTSTLQRGACGSIH